MNLHSQIYDNFFEDPLHVRDLIHEAPMADHTASDGVTYPGITVLPTPVHKEMTDKLKTLLGPGFEENVSFARYSFETMQPPHWAHSDRNMTQFLCLIYLNPVNTPESYGTYLVRHKRYGFETHPQTDGHKQILMRDSNEFSKWNTVFYCPSKLNRAFVLNASYLHASAGRFGKTREDSRLVITCFFNLNQRED